MIYDDIRDCYQEIRELRGLVYDLPAAGPFTLLLALLITIYAGMKEVAKVREIEQLKWEATIQKEYDREIRRVRQQALNDAETIYDAEVAKASGAGILASKIRFYEKLLKSQSAWMSIWRSGICVQPERWTM